MPAPLPPRTTAIRSALTGLLLATALGLTGCAGTGAAASPDSSADPGRSHSDTAHEDLAHSDMSHSDMSHSGMSDSAGQPSAAAAMICSADIRDAIAAVLALPEPVAGQDSYTGAHYACTYPLAGGPLELAVHEGADPAAAQAYADSIRADYGTAENIEGLANLGFPAYRTAEGAVVFVKDSMVLVVDARGVTVPEGADSPSRTDAAYQIATNVLACWKEHHSG
jgi:hypothetical protein